MTSSQESGWPQLLTKYSFWKSVVSFHPCENRRCSDARRGALDNCRKVSATSRLTV